MKREPGSLTRFYTNFTILGAVFVVGGIFQLTNGKYASAAVGLIVGLTTIIFSEWQVRRARGR